jgi:hypothetical protein
MKSLIILSLSLLSFSAQAMPRVGIVCTVTAGEGGQVKMVVNRYLNDLSDSSVSYRFEESAVSVSQKDIAQFKNDGKELYLKFYQDPAAGNDADLTGFKLSAKQGQKKLTGTLTYFEVPHNPGPMKDIWSLPVDCQYEE